MLPCRQYYNIVLLLSSLKVHLTVPQKTKTKKQNFIILQLAGWRSVLWRSALAVIQDTWVGYMLSILVHVEVFATIWVEIESNQSFYLEI